MQQSTTTFNPATSKTVWREGFDAFFAGRNDDPDAAPAWREGYAAGFKRGREIMAAESAEAERKVIAAPERKPQGQYDWRNGTWTPCPTIEDDHEDIIAFMQGY